MTDDASLQRRRRLGVPEDVHECTQAFGVCQCVNVSVCQRFSVAVWQCGSVAVCSSVLAFYSGSMAVC